jgi:hypothetical protein
MSQSSCGRRGVEAWGRRRRERSDVTLDLDLGSIGISPVAFRAFAGSTPTRRHALTRRVFPGVADKLIALGDHVLGAFEEIAPYAGWLH